MKTHKPDTKPEPPRLRLPGFVREEEVGIGDLITRAATAIGVPSCGGCGRRAAAMNRWVAFGRRTSK